MDKAIEKALQAGDLNLLTPEQRSQYYLETCQSLGLNPNTRPFKYLELWDSNKKKKVLHLYASKDCTEQLRKLHKVTISKLERELVKELKIYTVTVYFSLPDGRQDSSIGAVSLEKYDKDARGYVPLQGDDLANAIMKAETKAKRRGTLAICGLGMLDESELESMRDFQYVPDSIDSPELTEDPISPFMQAAITLVQKGIDQGLWEDDKREAIQQLKTETALKKSIAKMEDLMRQAEDPIHEPIENPGEATLAKWLDEIVDADGDAEGFRAARDAKNWTECQRIYVDATEESK